MVHVCMDSCDTFPLCQQCHTLLYVYNLPANKDGKSVSNRLRRLSDNCGGKVLSITGCSAVLRFLTPESAARAQKRMENEDVFGNRIVVSFTPQPRELCDTRSSGAIADKAKSPKKLKNAKLCLGKDVGELVPGAKAASGKGASANLGSASKNPHLKSLQVTSIPPTSLGPGSHNSGPTCLSWPISCYFPVPPSLHPSFPSSPFFILLLSHLFSLLFLSCMCVCVRVLGGSDSSRGLMRPHHGPVSSQELCRLETKMGTRSSEHLSGHLRLAVPVHRNTGNPMAVSKPTGLPDPSHKANPK